MANTPGTKEIIAALQGGDLSPFIAANPGASGTEDRILWSWEPGVSGDPRSGGEALDPRKSKREYLSIDEAKLKWYEDEAFRDRVSVAMRNAGIIDDEGDYKQALAAWNAVVEEAANFSKAGNDMTPFQVIEVVGGMSPDAKEQDKSPFTETRVDKSYNVLDDGTARVMVRTMYKQLLGRDPDKGELASLTQQLVALSKKKAASTRTETRYEWDERTQSMRPTGTTSTPLATGFTQDDAETLLQDRLSATDEFGGYQAATTYMGVLEGLLRAPGGL